MGSVLKAHRITSWGLSPIVDILLSVALASAEDVWSAYSRMGELAKEHVVVLGVNARGMLSVEETVSIGTLTSSLMHPREIMRPLLRYPCSGFILVHNHPSGDPAPSSEDKEVTSRLRRAGELMGIPLVDHVIIAKEKYFSFKDTGLL